MRAIILKEIHRIERKPRVSLGGQAADIRIRTIRLLTRWRINYAGILFASLRKWNAQRQPGDGAVWNGAKTGCAAKRSASLRSRETHIWTVLTHFALPSVQSSFVVRGPIQTRSRRNVGVQFTYQVARTWRMLQRILSRYFDQNLNLIFPLINAIFM